MYGPLIAELRQGQANLMTLYMAMLNRKVRIAPERPGIEMHVEDRYRDEIFGASNALGKAATALEQLDS